MGVGISASDGRKAASIDLAADEEIPWEVDVVESWQQDSAPSSAALDTLLGQNRAPIRKGQSFSKRVENLGARLHSIAGDMESAFSFTDLSMVEQLKHQGVTVSLSTPQSRVFGRVPSMVPSNRLPGTLAFRPGHVTGSYLRPTTALQSHPRNLAKDMPHIKLDTGSSEAASGPALHVNSITRRQRGESDSGISLTVKGQSDWRQNIAHAQHTAIGTIGAVSKLGVLARVAPRRTFQGDSLSFLVRDGFGENFQRVAETMEQYQAGRNSAHAAQDAIEAAKALEASMMESQLMSPPLTKPRISSSARKSPTSVRKPLYSPSPPPSVRPGTSNGHSRPPRVSDASIISSPGVLSPQSPSSLIRGASGPVSAASITRLQSQGLQQGEVKPSRFSRVRASDPSGKRPFTAGASQVQTMVQPNTPSMEDMIADLKKGTSLMNEAGPLLSVFAHRGNVLPLKEGKWGGPVVHQASNFSRVAKGGVAEQYRKTVATKLNEGRFAIQVMMGEDFLTNIDGQTTSLWSVDPWKQLETVFPARVASLERVEGVCMGVRLLLSLVMNIEALAGSEAVKKLHLIINCVSKQQERLIADLTSWNFCGLERENVLIMVEKPRRGYALDKDQERFVTAPSSEPRLSGAGFTLLHTAWPREGRETLNYMKHFYFTSPFSYTAAFILARPPGGSEGEVVFNHDVLEPALDGKHMIQFSALEYLASRGCEWLITRRLHDISFLSSSIIDVDEMAYGIFLSEEVSANFFVYVDSTARGISGKNLVIESSSTTHASVVEIKASSLCTTAMIQACAELKAASGGKLSVSSHRYMMSISHLQAKLSSPGAMKPALSFLDGLVYLQFDISDLSLSTGTMAVAFSNKTPAPSFISLSEAESILPMVHSQDAKDRFRGLLSLAASNLSQTRPIVKAAVKPGSELDSKPSDGLKSEAAGYELHPRGKCVVLLLSDNNSTLMAFNLVLSMLRPGYDHLHLVTCKSYSSSESACKILCEKYDKLARASLASIHTSVLSSGSLISAIEDHVEKIAPDLVVIGSQSHLQTAAQLPIGSVSIALLRNLRCPVLYVNYQAALSRIEVDKGDPFRVMVAVDHGSRPLLNFLCDKILNPARHDQVFLARGRSRNNATNEELVTTRRLLDDFSVIAARSKVESVKRPLDGDLALEGPNRAAQDRCHVLAVQIPIGKAGSLPDKVNQLLKRSRSAILVFKSNSEF